MVPERLFALPQDAVLDVPRSKKGNGYEKVSWKIEPFPMAQVKLRSGPLKDAMEINRRYLASIPNDRLLHTFRITAGSARMPNRSADGKPLTVSFAVTLPGATIFPHAR